VVTADPIAIDDGGGGGGGGWDPTWPEDDWLPDAPWGDDDGIGGGPSEGDDTDEEESECGGSTGGGSDSPPPTGGDDPCGSDCYDPPTDDSTTDSPDGGGSGNDGPHDAPGFMVGATWHVVTSSGLIAAPYDPAGYTLLNAGCNTADDPVPKAEVADQIIEECELSESTDPHTMADIFEESVRATFNASSSHTHQFGSGSHPHLTNPVDGYSTAAFDMENGEQLNVITSVMEVKFSESPSGLMSSGQSQTHIDDLAASYNMFPSDSVTGAPLYILVSNSQRPVDEIGRYSYGGHLICRLMQIRAALI